LPPTRATTVDGLSGAVPPSGRFVTPVGTEVNLTAPKPFGMDLSPNGNAIATIKERTASRSFSLSLEGFDEHPI
jgi:hypothetical protein